jgi:hypothetical protein
MSEEILQVNFKLNISAEEYRQAASSLAGEFAQVDGLLWKIWILNEDEKEAGGIYFFKNKEALDAYLNGPLAAQVKSHPALTDMSAKRFSIMSEVSVITRGPI